MTTRYHKKTLCLAALLCVRALSAAKTPEKECEGAQTMRASVRHIESRGIGYNKGYSSLDIFLAPPKDLVVLPFIDLRGHAFNNGNWAANAGIGVRGIPTGFSTVLGINAYYDWRNTTKKSYNQGSLGIEALGPVWEFRANGYLPFGHKQSRHFGLKFHEFKGHHIIAQRQVEFAMWGVDAEAGAHFKQIKDFDFYAAAGPYYFSGQVGKNAVGGKVRLWGQWKDYVRVEVMNSYDSVFNEIVQGQVILSYPFGPKPKLTRKVSDGTCARAQILSERLVQRVERQEIIVVDRHKQHLVAKNPATGDPYQVWFVKNTSHSLGTVDSPFPTLVQAQNASAQNDIIYVFSGDGTSMGMDAGITLKDGQKLLGTGAANPLQTTIGSITIPSRRSFPVITNANTANPAITLADNNEVGGLQMGDDAGILTTAIAASPNTSTVNIHNNNILNVTNGIDMSPTTTAQNNFTFADNTFVSQTVVSPGNAINITGAQFSQQFHTLTGNNFQGHWNIAIQILGLNNTQTVTGTNNSFSGVYGQAIFISPTGGSVNFNVSDNNFNTTQAQFFQIFPNGTIVEGSFSRNTCINSSLTAGQVGFFTNNNSVQNVSLIGNSISGGFIQIGDGQSTNTMNITGNTLISNNPTQQAIVITPSEDTITIANNTISGYETGILSLNASPSTLNIHILGNNISQVTTDAVFFEVFSPAANVCLQLENNITDSIYDLDNSASGGTTNFNVQTPLFNQGSIVTHGVVIFNATPCP